MDCEEADAFLRHLTVIVDAHNSNVKQFTAASLVKSVSAWLEAFVKAATGYTTGYAAFLLAEDRSETTTVTWHVEQWSNILVEVVRGQKATLTFAAPSGLRVAIPITSRYIDNHALYHTVNMLKT